LFTGRCNKLKNKKYHSVKTLLKSIRKIVVRNKIDIPNTQIHDRLPSLVGTGTSNDVIWIK